MNTTRHWNGKVFILMKCSSLAALEVVKMTTSSAASDENFVKMTTFWFQWITLILTVICHRSLAAHSCVSGLLVHTKRWVYDKITLHLLCYLTWVGPMLSTFVQTICLDVKSLSDWILFIGKVSVKKKPSISNGTLSEMLSKSLACVFTTVPFQTKMN